MKMLKKLALVSAVSMISAGAFAMEAMDDESMAAATGQDGITILIAPGTRTAAELTALGVSAASQTAIDLTTNGVPGADGVFKGLSINQVVIHDDDGWTVAQGGTAATANSGAIVIGDGTAADSTVVFADNASPISVVIDAVGDSDSGVALDQPMLNVAISTPQLGIKVGAVYVADSNSANGATVALDTDGTAHDTRVKIMNKMEIILGAMTTNIQLGNETQGGMIAINASLIGGLSIADFATNDANSGGSIAASSLKMVDAGGANLTASVVINANGTAGVLGEGLYVTIAQLGHATNGLDLTLNDVYLGDTALTNINTANLGDVQMLGLNLSGSTLVIRGH